MTCRPALVLAFALVAAPRLASGDPEADAGRSYEAAAAKAGAEDPSAIDAFEAIGASRPVTRWHDNAWAKAAELAERAGDFARARRDLEQAIAIGDPDDRLVQRAKASLERIAKLTGDARWDATARAHARLVADAHSGDDPRDALSAIEQLLHAQPEYPRATELRLALADGWEREGDDDRGLAWFRDAYRFAPASERERAGLALARAAIRAGAGGEAARVLDALAAAPDADRGAIADARDALATAEYRTWLRRALGLVLAALALVAAVLLRRDAGSWRAAARRIARPPVEVLYLAPIAIVLIAVAVTGNPVVGNAVTAIVAGGLAIAWLSGAALDASRHRRGRLTVARAFAHAGCLVVAVGALAYLAIDHFRVVDLVLETWRHGPAAR